MLVTFRIVRDWIFFSDSKYLPWIKGHFLTQDPHGVQPALFAYENESFNPHSSHPSLVPTRRNFFVNFYRGMEGGTEEIIAQVYNSIIR